MKVMTPQTFVPKRVTQQQQPQVWPDRTLPFHPDVQPIWGHAARMLTQGGPWDLTEDPEAPRKPNGAPRNLDSRPSSYEDGTFEYEPDPALSTLRTTGALVRAMWRAGWTREQAEDQLLIHGTTGGAYWFWRSGSDEFMKYLWTETAASENNPYFLKPSSNALSTANQEQVTSRNSTCSLGGEAITTSPRKDTWNYLPEVGQEVLRWVAAHPGQTQKNLTDALVTHVTGVHPRNARKYLTALAGQGLIRSRVQKTSGRQGRPPVVWITTAPCIEYNQPKPTDGQADRSSGSVAEVQHRFEPDDPDGLDWMASL